MGQYKVPQNVEAEDKIIGPLTLKQFIYALIGIGWGLICFATLHKLIPVMILLGAPPVILFMLLAFFTRDGQNFEQLLIAMVGYFANPRRRRWIKEEVVEAFHIEATPLVVEQTQRNPAEVRSQLEHIASMVDSRGWEHHTVAVGTPPADPSAPIVVTPASTPAALVTEPAPSEDIFDLQHSPLAQNLSELINNAASDVRQEAIEQMKSAPIINSPATVTAPSSSGIVELATERDDLTVSQLAATATRMVPMQPGEVVEVRGNGNTTAN
ncbi:PrgI family protein [Candidatus Saccharibacteria bacterium]|nr:PrgI family protein [Candidatus Saccharibacteria bacterium]